MGIFFKNTNIQRLSECLNLNFAIKISEKNGTHWKSIAKNKTHGHVLPFFPRKNKKKHINFEIWRSFLGRPCEFFLQIWGEHMIPIKCWSQTCASWQVVEFEVIFRSVGVLLLFWAFLVPDIKRWDVFLCGQKEYVFKFDCELYLW